MPVGRPHITKPKGRFPGGTHEVVDLPLYVHVDAQGEPHVTMPDLDERWHIQPQGHTRTNLLTLCQGVPPGQKVPTPGRIREDVPGEKYRLFADQVPGSKFQQQIRLNTITGAITLQLFAEHFPSLEQQIEEMIGVMAEVWVRARHAAVGALMDRGIPMAEAFAIVDQFLISLLLKLSRGVQGGLGAVA